MSHCEECLSRIDLYLDDELREEQLEVFNRHIRDCSSCRRELAHRRVLPPVSPSSDPIACNKRQLIAPALGQLASEPAGVAATRCPHTLLLSRELCQVGLPKRSGLGANSLGFVSGLRKCVAICTASPKMFVNRVASGRALLTVQEAPEPAGRQT